MFSQRFLNTFNKNILVQFTQNYNQNLKCDSAKFFSKNVISQKSYPILNVLRSSSKCNNFIQNKRELNTTNLCKNYEGDGKTTISDMKDDVRQHVMIDAYSIKGFALSNGAFALGPLILFPNVFLSVSLIKFYNFYNSLLIYIQYF